LKQPVLNAMNWVEYIISIRFAGYSSKI